MFSKDVLDSGQALFLHFCKLRHFILNFTKKLTSSSEGLITDIAQLNQKKQKLEAMLEQLD